MQGAAPDAWVTDRVCPATVKVVVLEVPVLVLTEKPTVPLPVPLAPEVIWTQEPLLTAVQGQVPVEGVTLMLPVPPEDAKEAKDCGLTLKEQDGAVPS